MRKEITYVSNDGKKFPSKKLCLQHEEWLDELNSQLIPEKCRSKIMFFDRDGNELDYTRQRNRCEYIYIREKDEPIFSYFETNELDNGGLCLCLDYTFKQLDELELPIVLIGKGWCWYSVDECIELSLSAIESLKEDLFLYPDDEFSKNNLEEEMTQLNHLISIKSRILNAPFTEWKRKVFRTKVRRTSKDGEFK